MDGWWNVTEQRFTMSFHQANRCKTSKKNQADILGDFWEYHSDCILHESICEFLSLGAGGKSKCTVATNRMAWAESQWYPELFEKLGYQVDPRKVWSWVNGGVVFSFFFEGFLLFFFLWVKDWKDVCGMLKVGDFFGDEAVKLCQAVTVDGRKLKTG